jgi:3-oxoacyl-[acyl-carrier protein] reductase
MDFSQKNAVVTGGSRGIGRTIVQQLADRGARVVIHYNQNRKAAEQTLNSIEGGPHAVVQADVTDPDSARNLVDTAVREMGKIDILVNNAGIYELHPMLDCSYEKWQDVWIRTLGINLLGPANVSFLVVQHMKQHGGGKIVNVSSRGAFRGEPEAPAYGASKAGLNAMSQSMAKALAPYNIFVYVVAPGFVETEMAALYLSGSEGDAIRQQSPLGRVARPEEVARTVLFLASEGSEYLTGCIVDINGASYLRS